MNDQDAKSGGGSEPSMEDILASIRRILAEDADASLNEPNGQTAAASGNQDEPATDGRGEERARQTVLKEQRDDDVDSDAAFAEESISDQTSAYGLAPSERAKFVRDTLDVELHQSDEDGEDDDEVFLLTPDMRIAVSSGSVGSERVVSQRTTESSTDVLAQLASAILDRRDILVSNRDVTLESMVREMLRPLLREWLDRNLPYLIERLVKREIDLMVNRAERLER
ncbi:MAG: DUF2497 domain-containing protein [Rhodospirillales bacterium]|nr:DUF2497 domain-containing protein [Rhodospirillales bacterium]